MEDSANQFSWGGTVLTRDSQLTGGTTRGMSVCAIPFPSPVGASDGTFLKSRLDTVALALSECTRALEATDDASSAGEWSAANTLAISPEAVKAVLPGILRMDARLTADHLAAVAEVWPTPQERRRLVALPPSGTAPAAEQWMAQVSLAEEKRWIARAVGKVGAAAAARAFEEAAAGVAGHVALLRAAMGQVAASVRLRGVVEHFLSMAKDLGEPADHGLSAAAMLKVGILQPFPWRGTFFVCAWVSPRFADRRF